MSSDTPDSLPPHDTPPLVLSKRDQVLLRRVAAGGSVGTIAADFGCTVAALRAELVRLYALLDTHARNDR